MALIIHQKKKKMLWIREHAQSPRGWTGCQQTPRQSHSAGSHVGQECGASPAVEVPLLGDDSGSITRGFGELSSLRTLQLIQIFSHPFSQAPGSCFPFGLFRLQSPSHFLYTFPIAPFLRLPVESILTHLVFFETIISSHWWVPNPQPFLTHRLTRSYVKQHHIISS